MAKSLVSEGLSPPDAFAWTYHTDSTWWAIGDLGRTKVAVPTRYGWPVGDYPWEGRVDVAQGSSVNEVFVRPTYVDAEGRIVPKDATRTTMLNLDLLTDEMCHEIADTMQEIAAAAHEPAPAAPTKRHTPP